MLRKYLLLLLCWFISLHAATQGLKEKDTAKLRPGKPVMLTLAVIDSTTRKSLKATVTVDSSQVRLLRLIRRDTGKYEILLFPGYTYQISATAPGYHPYQGEFVAAQKPDSLAVALNAADTALIHDDRLPVDPGNADMRNLNRNYNQLLVAVIFLSLLTLLTGFLNIYAIKRYRSMGNPISTPSVLQIAEEQPAAAVSPVEQEPQAKVATENEDRVAMAALSTEETVADRQVTDRYFVCELMMTAGPRKKYMGQENADKDLGEDVCGFVAAAQEVAMWLLDGTSDLHCLKNPENNTEYFSSRLLALSIADQLRKRFIRQDPGDFSVMVNNGLTEVKKSWLETINLLPQEEKQLLKKSIENKNYPECATTLLTARLSCTGDFTAYRSGDSKMFIFGAEADSLRFIQTTLADKNDQSNDRVFFRLYLNEEGNFDILFNEPLHEIIEQKGIHTIISFSDGIGMATEQLLRQEYDGSPDKIRREIMYHAQETGDDKSICFIELKAISRG